jgi:DegV family protein with EDD domain
MTKVCILTDSTAQFPTPAFAGSELVNVIPFHVRFMDSDYSDGKDLRTIELPVTSRNGTTPLPIAPSPQEFFQIFSSLSQKYKEIVAILISSQLSQAVANAKEAAEAAKGPAEIHIIDSQTTAIGLGYIVQAAAEAALYDNSGAKIHRMIRGLNPHIYSVFCLQNLTYLSHSGYLDPAQAMVGEMLGIIPFFILENGRLVPIQKIRNSRHLVDILHEFLSEFDLLKHIAIVQGTPPYEQEVRNLKERLNEDFPSTTFSEHNLGIVLASMLGPRSLGMFMLEACPELDKLSC